MLTNTPYASPERLLAAAVRERVSLSLGDWIGSQFAHGATVEDVKRQLTSALGQIGRMEKYIERNYAEIQRLQEIADGAWGDNPMVRGQARDEIKRRSSLSEEPANERA
jgi:hypothetical protein